MLAAAEAVVPGLIAAGMECYLLALPRAWTPTRTPSNLPMPAQALGEVIRKATWQGKGASPAVPVVEAPQTAPASTEDDDISPMMALGTMTWTTMPGTTWKTKK